MSDTIDHSFARQVLGANGFKRVGKTDMWHKDVFNLTHGVNLAVDVGPDATGVLTVTAARVDGKGTPIVKSDANPAEVYAEAISLAHTLAG